MHNYIFWLENDEIESYKNGNIMRYSGEDSFNLANGIDNFFDKWESNAGYVEGELINFIFLGREKDKLSESYKAAKKRYNLSEDEEVKFQDIKSILDRKDLKKFTLKSNSDEYSFEKNEYSYELLKRETEDIIWVLTEKFSKAFINEDGLEIETNRDEDISPFVKYCKEKINKG